MYSSSEVRRPSSKEKTKYSSFLSTKNESEPNKKEIKEVLIKKIREFRDLVQLYQRRNHIN